MLEELAVRAVCSLSLSSDQTVVVVSMKSCGFVTLLTRLGGALMPRGHLKSLGIGSTHALDQWW